MSSGPQGAARKARLRLIDDTTIHNRRDSITSNAQAAIRVEDQGPLKPTAARNSWGLTKKQTDFARYVADGETLRKAYRLAYEAKPSTPDNQVDKHAQRIAKIGLVVDLVQAYKAEKERLASHCEPDLRTFVLTGLRKEAMDGDSSAARIRAMELLGKVTEIGLFTERSSTEVMDKRDESQVKAELLQRLNKLIPENVE